MQEAHTPAKMVPERLELATLPTTYVTILTIVLFLLPSDAPAALMRDVHIILREPASNLADVWA